MSLSSSTFLQLFQKRKNKKLLSSYQDPKTEHFDFEKISLYFNHCGHDDYFQVISDRTASDLDFEELFHFLDRTCSSLGQQYLYSCLRTIPNDSTRVEEFENYIKFLQENEKQKEAIILTLSKLKNSGAYFIQSLFNKAHIQRPKWFFIVPILSLSAISLLVGVFFYPPLLLAFIGVVFINFILHYWNKRNLISYSNSIPQLNTLNIVANQVLKTGVFKANHEEVSKSVKVIDRISKQTLILKWGAQTTDDLSQVFESFLELIKASFLIEILIMFRVLKTLENKKQDLKRVYESVAKLDVSLTIHTLRETTPTISIPNVLKDQTTSLSTKDIYHPLIENPIANSIILESKNSAIITGSNMSGKTTFIRTLGINAILAQTLNIAFASELRIPKMKVHSAIRISDDLLENTSYYYEEVNVIKEFIQECENEYINLFLLDELFKGTNTIERVASGKAVLSHLSSKRNIVFASTHDIELADFLESSFEFYHFTEKIENDELVFDYKIKTGKLTETNAIRVLEINGYLKVITEEARTLASQLSKIKKN